MCASQVRRRAYQGLAGYPADALEVIGALRPLRAYAAPLLREADADARAAAGELADAALAYEHANRRRRARLHAQLRARHVIRESAAACVYALFCLCST